MDTVGVTWDKNFKKKTECLHEATHGLQPAWHVSNMLAIKDTPLGWADNCKGIYLFIAAFYVSIKK